MKIKPTEQEAEHSDSAYDSVPYDQVLHVQMRVNYLKITLSRIIYDPRLRDQIDLTWLTTTREFVLVKYNFIFI